MKLRKVIPKYSNESNEQAVNQSQEQGFQQNPVTFQHGLVFRQEESHVGHDQGHQPVQMAWW